MAEEQNRRPARDTPTTATLATSAKVNNAPFAEPDETAAEGMLAMANRLRESGSIKSALMICERLLALKPDFIDALRLADELRRELDPASDADGFDSIAEALRSVAEKDV